MHVRARPCPEIFEIRGTQEFLLFVILLSAFRNDWPDCIDDLAFSVENFNIQKHVNLRGYVWRPSKFLRNIAETGNRAKR